MLDSIQYEFLFFFTTYADPEPGAGAENSTFRLQFRLLAAPAPAPQHWCVRMFGFVPGESVRG
jgi:hypothetical protein